MPKMKGLAEKAVMFLTVTWFLVAMAVAGVLWLLAVPFRLRQTSWRRPGYHLLGRLPDRGSQP
ncbi:MAG: hypothetical protein JRI50_10810 [Deltaproteobacteria bacterium]|nr:hypothetical protein [Deltaproteobacteria bacterium]